MPFPVFHFMICIKIMAKTARFPSSLPLAAAKAGALPVSSLTSLPGIQHLSAPELDKLEQAFKTRAEQAKRPEHKISRLRLWLVFVLLRHAALRLGEALALNDDTDIDLTGGILHVRGQHARAIPLTHGLLPVLRRFFSQAALCSQRGTLCALDPGFVRRNFYDRARECGLSPALASPKSIRQARAVELIEGGMPLPAVQNFLGQPSLKSTGELLDYDESDIKAITSHYLRKETKLKTSARNVFPGIVHTIRQSGFMAEVGLKSFNSLEVVAVITQESLENLQIAVGKTVIATVKAPFVIISRDEGSMKTCARNKFSGVISALTRSEVLCEVVVDLREGCQVCALVTTTSADELDLAVHTPVTVLFKAFSVVLSVA